METKDNLMIITRRFLHIRLSIARSSCLASPSPLSLSLTTRISPGNDLYSDNKLISQAVIPPFFPSSPLDSATDRAQWSARSSPLVHSVRGHTEGERGKGEGREWTMQLLWWWDGGEMGRDKRRRGGLDDDSEGERMSLVGRVGERRSVGKAR